MEKPSTLFTGIFGAFIISTGAMVLLPNSQIGNLQPTVGDWDGTQPSPTDVYPVDRRLIGRDVYVANGCFYCHTQQVRDLQYGPDMPRGWGNRRTVARDYLYENVPLLGSTRMGPDLANYGAAGWRNEQSEDTKKPAARDAAWVFKHLYNPRTFVSDSNCPPQTGMFTRHVIGEKASPNAAFVEGREEWIPGDDARNLAAYLLSLDRSHPLPEAPTVIKVKEEKK